MALDVPFSLEVLVKGVATKLREPGTPLPRYLQSRSLAGATHKDIERGIHLATNGALGTKFFAFYPERKVSLSHWLHHWMSRGKLIALIFIYIFYLHTFKFYFKILFLNFTFTFYF